MAEAAGIDFSKLAGQGKKAATALMSMHVVIAGRIESSRRHEGKVYTHVLTPAPDAYSRPQLVEVRSLKRLGDKHDEIEDKCMLGGYQRKPYQVVDKETGERQTLVPVDHTLDLIEAD